jgi:hypothetical protein
VPLVTLLIPLALDLFRVVDQVVLRRDFLDVWEVQGRLVGNFCKEALVGQAITSFV